MKGSTTILVLFLAIVISAARQYGHTDSQSAAMEKYGAALAGIHKVLDPGVPVTVREPMVDGYFPSWSRYFLAPAYVAFSTPSLDTVLDVTPRNYADSLRNTTTQAGRRILWENTDDTYYYYLSASK